MSTNRSVAFACLMLAIGPVALAQQTPVTDEPPAPPRYNVEIIVFAHTDVDPAEERFDAEEFPAGNAAGNGSAPPPAAVIAVEPFGPRRAGPDGFGPAGPDAAPDTGLAGPAAADAGDGARAGADSAGAGTDAGSFAADGLELLDPFGTLSSRSAPGPAADPALAIRPLAEDELMLRDARRIIDRLGAYRLLGYGGWQQPGLDEADAVPVDIASIGIANPTGTVRLYLGRFLHVGLDLSYRAPISRQVTATLPTADAQGQPPGASDFMRPGRRTSLAEISLPERFRLQTERNAIRSGELHYVDHPRFGVLILVTPAPEPEDEAAAVADDSPSA